MASMQLLFLFLTIFEASKISGGLLQSEVGDSKAIGDGFRLFLPDIVEETVKEELDDFIQYKSEKIVVIRNKAESKFKLDCKAGISNQTEATIKPGDAFVFSFRPLKDGTTRAVCVLEYRQYTARFYVYNENLPYMCPREIDELYQYTVTHEGVFADGKAGSEGNKIRALAKGHNRFILWEEYLNETVDGYLRSAFVDGGMCDDVPDLFDDQTAAVTVCYHNCLHLYENRGCSGYYQTVEADDSCNDVPLDTKLAGKLSAVKGC